MPATATAYPRNDALGEARRLHNAVPAPFAVAPPDAAGSTRASPHARTAFIVESLAALALAAGGYLR